MKLLGYESKKPKMKVSTTFHSYELINKASVNSTGDGNLVMTIRIQH